MSPWKKDISSRGNSIEAWGSSTEGRPGWFVIVGMRQERWENHAEKLFAVSNGEPMI